MSSETSLHWLLRLGICCSVFVGTLSHFGCVWLFVTPWTLAHQAPLSMQILQARILGWFSMPSSRGSSQPRDWTFISYVFCIGRRVLYQECHLGSPTACLEIIKNLEFARIKEGGWVERNVYDYKRTMWMHEVIQYFQIRSYSRWIRILGGYYSTFYT